MIEGKGLGGKRVNRVNISLNNKFINKLNRLATACNMKPTTLAALLVELSLDDNKIVLELQDEYCTHTAYRVIPAKKYNDNIEYLLKED